MCHQADLQFLFEKYFYEVCSDIKQLPLSGSNRIYYHLKGNQNQAIGTYNTDRKENEAFIHFSTQFKAASLNVPVIYLYELDKSVYIQEFVGHTTVFDYLHKSDTSNIPQKEILNLYKQILNDLLQFQLKGKEVIDFSKAYPRATFDIQSMLWDLNYFKYYFLKLFHIAFNEQALEDDFQTLATYLNSRDGSFFMYRDFQTRNIMLKKDTLYYIDYQGGRKGPVHYDVASILYSSKANLSPELRTYLLEYYMSLIAPHLTVDMNEQFKSDFHTFVLLRIMQAMGAYGYRGLFERKEHFIQSIPFAIENIKYILPYITVLNKLPQLNQCLNDITQLKIHNTL